MHTKKYLDDDFDALPEWKLECLEMGLDDPRLTIGIPTSSSRMGRTQNSLCQGNGRTETSSNLWNLIIVWNIFLAKQEQRVFETHCTWLMFALWNWNICTKFSFTQKCFTLKERCSLVYRDHGTSEGHCQVEPTGQGSLEYISWSTGAMSSIAICNLLLTVIWPAISSFPQRCQSLNRCKTLFYHQISHGARKKQ